MDSKVSIQEMQRVAEAPHSDIGEVIRLNTSKREEGGFSDKFTTDMGIDLLTNPKKASISINPLPALPVDNIELKKSDELGVVSGKTEPLDFNSFDIPFIDLNASEKSKDSQISEIKIHHEVPFSNQSSTNTIRVDPNIERISREKELIEKREFLLKINRLRNKGYNVSRMFTMDSSLDEMRQEVDRLIDAKNLEKSIRFQRQVMMGMITGLEMLNSKFNPLEWELNGWSESIHENIDDYDEVFEELYDKYKGQISTSPEMRLMFMVAGSGFMFHMSNSFFKTKMNNVSLEEILKSNPQLARQFATAAANTASPGFGNFINMATNSHSQPPFPSKPDSQVLPPQIVFPSPISERGNLEMPGEGNPYETARKEMKGPSGMEDILKTFNEVRNINTVVKETNSIANSDIMSELSSSHEIPTRGGRKKRGPSSSVEGSTISLNV